MMANQSYVHVLEKDWKYHCMYVYLVFINSYVCECLYTILTKKFINLQYNSLNFQQNPLDSCLEKIGILFFSFSTPPPPSLEKSAALN